MSVERGVAMASWNCCIVYESLRSSLGPQHPTSLQLSFLLTAFCILNQLGLGERWPILNYVIYTGSKGKSKTFLNQKGNDQLVLGANCFNLEWHQAKLPVGRISVSASPAWSTKCSPAWSGLLHRVTLPWKNKQKKLSPFHPLAFASILGTCHHWGQSSGRDFWSDLRQEETGISSRVCVCLFVYFEVLQIKPRPRQAVY